jgi:hypothetical protein
MFLANELTMASKMKLLTFETFDTWMNAYGRASAENNPHASAELFATNAKYFESPFREPGVGRSTISAYWNNGTHSLSDKRSSNEVLAVVMNRGMARWQAEFNVIATGERISLDCVFLVEFNDGGQCTLFREWWHSKVIGRSLAKDCPGSGELWEHNNGNPRI